MTANTEELLSPSSISINNCTNSELPNNLIHHNPYFNNLNRMKNNTTSSSTAFLNIPTNRHQEDGFCIRWKGFHENMAYYLDSMKADDGFVDVTLASDGGIKVHAHKLILASSSPYFARILKDTSCQHPIVILNEVPPDILKALMTYMYRGIVFLSEDRLPIFFKTAVNLKIKGIAEYSQFSSTAHPQQLPVPTQLNDDHSQNQPHPVGDLSLLAAAATNSLSQISQTTKMVRDSGGGGSIGKRRKALPRRLDIHDTIGGFQNLHHRNIKLNHLSSNDENTKPLMDENFSSKAINLSMKKNYDYENKNNSNLARTDLLTIPNVIGNSNIKQEERYSPSSLSNTKMDIPLSPEALDMSQYKKDTTIHEQQPDKIIKMEEETSRETVRNGNKKNNATSSSKTVSNSITPEQMEALLGSPWKSRQPRMCKYCQRMFSNKFNLKQHILNMHTVGRELHCEICQKKVKNKWYMRRHHVTHHNAPLKK